MNHLVNPRAFHVIPEQNVPPAFSIDKQTLASLNLEQLIEQQHYVAAATRCEHELTSMYTEDPTSKNLDTQRIFYLWHVRMACLLGARYYNIAREESQVLGDLGADMYRDATGRSIVPWDFRLMIVPIQSGGDNQSALGRLYGLVREARAAALAAEEGPDRESWKAKLLDLGLYVASTLICMGDYVTALDHLHRLYKDTITRNVEFAGRVKPVLALVYLQVGDTFSAREWLGGTDTAALEQAVCSIADADFAAATTLLEALQPGDEESSDSVSFRIPVVNNLAITQLHQGDLSRAIELLESLAKNPHDHRLILTVISNLFFLYDLRYDDVKTKRYQVAEMLKSNGIGALASYTAFDR